MTKRINVCIFHTEFAYSGGAERLVIEHLKMLNSSGFEAICFTSFIEYGKVYPDILQRYKIKQILPNFLNKFLPHEFMVLLTCIFLPVFFYKFKKYDIFVGENQPGNFFAFLTAKFYKKPYISYFSWPLSAVFPRDIDKTFGVHAETKFVTRLILKVFLPLIKVIDKLSITNAKAVLVSGKYSSEVFERVYGIKIIVCSIGTYIQKKKLNIKERSKGKISINNKSIVKPYILMTNRHFPKKRLEYGIQVLDKMLKQKIQTSLVITGKETNYTDLLKKAAKELGIQSKVVFLGLVDENELSTLYANAAVYVYTAPEEDVGMGIIEAMSYGIPVVAFNKAGPSRIIESGKTGFLANVDSVNGLASYTKKLLTNPLVNKRISDNAFLESGNYSWDRHKQIFLRELKKFVLFS